MNLGEPTSVLDIAQARKELPSPTERRRVRTAARISRDAMAEELGVTPSAIYRWETGSDPSRRHVVAYVRLLKRLGDTLEPRDGR